MNILNMFLKILHLTVSKNELSLLLEREAQNWTEMI